MIDQQPVDEQMIDQQPVDEQMIDQQPVDEQPDDDGTDIDGDGIPDSVDDNPDGWPVNCFRAPCPWDGFPDGIDNDGNNIPDELEATLNEWLAYRMKLEAWLQEQMTTAMQNYKDYTLYYAELKQTYETHMAEAMANYTNSMSEYWTALYQKYTPYAAYYPNWAVNCFWGNCYDWSTQWWVATATEEIPADMGVGSEGEIGSGETTGATEETTTTTTGSAIDSAAIADANGNGIDDSIDPDTGTGIVADPSDPNVRIRLDNVECTNGNEGACASVASGCATDPRPSICDVLGIPLSDDSTAITETNAVRDPLETDLVAMQGLVANPLPTSGIVAPAASFMPGTAEDLAHQITNLEAELLTLDPTSLEYAEKKALLADLKKKLLELPALYGDGTTISYGNDGVVYTSSPVDQDLAVDGTQTLVYTDAMDPATTTAEPIWVDPATTIAVNCFVWGPGCPGYPTEDTNHDGKIDQMDSMLV